LHTLCARRVFVTKLARANCHLALPADRASNRRPPVWPTGKSKHATAAHGRKKVSQTDAARLTRFSRLCRRVGPAQSRPTIEVHVGKWWADAAKRRLSHTAKIPADEMTRWADAAKRRLSHPTVLQQAVSPHFSPRHFCEPENWPRGRIWRTSVRGCGRNGLARSFGGRCDGGRVQFSQDGLRARGEVLMNTTLTHERAVLFLTRREKSGLKPAHCRS
jgi:hypothetical protein